MRAGHAHVADERGAARKDLLIGGGNVRVRPNHRGNAPIQIPAHGHFFAGRFRVDIHDDNTDARGDARQLAVGGAERAINGGHEDAALEIQHRIPYAVLRRAEVQPAPGIPVGKVCRAQQARLVGNVLEDFLAVPDMVASGKYFHAGGEQLFDETRRDAEAGSGVLAIGNHQIHFLLRDDVGKAFPDDLPAGRTDDISNEKDAHKSKMERTAWPCGARS